MSTTQQSNYLVNVAIIGAGLGGCALALALSAHRVPITIYESRPQEAPDEYASGVILTPNGLAILDLLGVYSRIKDRCYVSTHRTFKNDRDETIRKTAVASVDVYGYQNHRIWRRLLLDEIKTMLQERGINIKYSSRLQGPIVDSADGVIFTINSQLQHATLLLGCDGIYSSVRKLAIPGASHIEPEYTGVLGLLTHIKRASVAWPTSDYERNATIQGKPGALFFLPEDPEGEDIMIGMQVQHPPLTREELQRLQADKEGLVAMWRRGYEEWGTTARSIIDQIAKNSKACYVWPFVRIPRLQSWFSETGRVVIMGDAAHAVPPSSGQGINQALEDLYSLTLLLTAAPMQSEIEATMKDYLLKALEYWQGMRQERIDAVFDWATNATNVQRLPEAERKKLIAEGTIKEGKAGEGDDMSWLYKLTLVEDVNAWIESQS